jgi:N,N-dimethylformamidase
MSIKFLTSDNQGIIYTVTDTGDLLYYRDEARDGTVRWSFDGAGQKIGSGWDSFLNVFSGDDGIIYAIASNGDLLYYRDDARNGTSNWAFGGTGQKLASGWDAFAEVFYGGDGVIYAVAPNGDLSYFRDETRDGAAHLSFGGVGQKINTGWGGFRHISSGGDGSIYAVEETGDVLYFKDETRNGTAGWAFGGTGQKIGSGWATYAAVFSGGNGIIYAITADGFFQYQRDEARNGTAQWSNNGIGQQIGSGWFLLPPAADVQGYCAPLSAGSGDTVNFSTSAKQDYKVTYLRLKHQPDGSPGTAMADPISVSGAIQAIPDEAWQNGCGWKTSFSLNVPGNWPSGIYAAECTDTAGDRSYMVFIVKPRKKRRNKIAVLANTNTWNAYNDWGGRSKYSMPPATAGSFARPNPWTTPIDDGQLNHLTRAELWVLNWLEDTGYSVDVYTDQDFHGGINGFNEYKALILSTHPEYWTVQMFDNLVAYLKAGGSVLYLSGNGVFERCEYSADATSLIFWGGDPSQGRERNLLRNLNPPRPERSVLGVAFVFNNMGVENSTPGPYRVEMAEHPFFGGTVSNGDLIGQEGLNGAASGWEIDISDAGHAPDGVIVSGKAGDDRGVPPNNIQVLARGTNKPTDGPYTAHLTYYETGNGGFVLSAGSLCFSGSLVKDATLQTVVKNALNKATQGP